MPIKAILFDIDGTLVDSNDRHAEAWDVAFAEQGHRFDRQVLHDQIGKGTDMLVPSLLPDADEDEQEAFGDRHGAVFQQRFLQGIEPFPHARDLLAAVQAAGCAVVLASSAAQCELDHYVELLDARDLVSATTTAEDVERTKPAPDIFTVALGKLDGIGADEALVVGDTPYDMQAAGKAGLRGVAVRSGGFPDAALTEGGALAIYDDVAAILADLDAALLSR